MDIINFSKIAAPKFEFGCGFYFCVIGALKYIIGIIFYIPAFDDDIACLLIANI